MAYQWQNGSLASCAPSILGHKRREATLGLSQSHGKEVGPLNPSCLWQPGPHAAPLCTGTCAPPPSYTVRGHTQGPYHARHPQPPLVNWTPEMEPLGGLPKSPFLLFLRGGLAPTGPKSPGLGARPLPSCKLLAQLHLLGSPHVRQARASLVSGDPGTNPGRRVLLGSPHLPEPNVPPTVTGKTLSQWGRDG